MIPDIEVPKELAPKTAHVEVLKKVLENLISQTCVLKRQRKIHFTLAVSLTRASSNQAKARKMAAVQ